MLFCCYWGIGGNTMKRRVHTIACLLAVLLCGGLLFAQSDRATITGTVKDSTSAVLPGVQVRVTNVGTNDALTTVTDNAGYYRVGNLPVGNYAVSYSREGFKTLDRRGITLLIGQVAEINAALVVGGKSEVVEVTSAAPVLQRRPRISPQTWTIKQSMNFHLT